MKDKVLFYFLGVLTMIVVYGFTQTATKPVEVPKKTSIVEQDIQTIKSDVADIKKEVRIVGAEVEDLQQTADDIKNDTSSIDTIYMAIDALGTELTSPEGGAEGLRADVSEIKTLAYDIKTTVRHLEAIRMPTLKNNYPGEMNTQQGMSGNIEIGKLQLRLNKNNVIYVKYRSVSIMIQGKIIIKKRMQ